MVFRCIKKVFQPGSNVKNLPAMQTPAFNPWVGKIPWKREWQSIPVFLPGKSYGQRRLAGYILWVCKESDNDLVTNIFTLFTSTRNLQMNSAQLMLLLFQALSIHLLKVIYPVGPHSHIHYLLALRQLLNIQVFPHFWQEEHEAVAPVSEK